MHHPPDFHDPRYTNHVFHLHIYLFYDLKHTFYTWYHRFPSMFHVLDFSTATDPSLFIYQSPYNTSYLLLYVDHTIIITTSMTFLHQNTSLLSHYFVITNLGALNYFVSISMYKSLVGFSCLNKSIEMKY